jgi:N-acetylmuramoyl-L-alanine amidase
VRGIRYFLPLLACAWGAAAPGEAGAFDDSFPRPRGAAWFVERFERIPLPVSCEPDEQSHPATPVFRGTAGDWRGFDPYYRRVPVARVRERLRRWLERNRGIERYFSIGEDAIRLYASPSDRRENRPEYVFQLGTAPTPVAFPRPAGNRAHPLQGVRIAIDPGHSGGGLAHIEERYIDMAPVPEVGGRSDLHFDEGTLALLTAQRLRRLLEGAGAEVLLTHEAIGTTVYKDFNRWRESAEFAEAVSLRLTERVFPDDFARELARWNLFRAPDTEVFRAIYNEYEMKARAERINAFHPDLTLVIHFNGTSRKNAKGDFLGTDENYSEVFIPGAFMDDELRDPASRYEFLRLLVSGDVEESVRVGGCLAGLFGSALGTPLADERIGRREPRTAMLPAGPPGVFARNLALTRRIHGPLVYGETLIQDNYQESQRLADRSLSIDQREASYRLEQVARAYYLAVLATFGNRPVPQLRRFEQLDITAQ